MINYKKYPFAQKIRHHVTATYYIPLKDLPFLPNGYPPLIEFKSWDNYFLNAKKPDVIDIGCGKGLFLLTYAALNPNQNILGIELRSEAVDWLNSIIDGEKIANANIMWYSIVNGLDFIRDESIDRIFYLFPDPWPKLRHHKRRAFSMEFVAMCYAKLRKGGEMFLATDVEDVDNCQPTILYQFGKFDIETLEIRDKWELPTTNKENFCIIKNIPVYRHICRKI